MERWKVTAFYHFHSVEESKLEERQKTLEAFGKDPAFCGLVLLATEGINGTIAGPAELVEKFKQTLVEITGQTDIDFKTSWSDFKPFKRYKVKIKPEVCTYDEGVKPSGAGASETHLPPVEWHRMMTEEDVIVIDTRNKYETEVGMFKGAVDPEIDMFTEFKDYVDQADLPKDKPILMYCTGGIRCEKAVPEMQARGFDNVFQLQGGILKYLEEYPDGLWDGECFVFDHRVAVDSNLEPSKKYKLCPHCGDPGQVPIDCAQCSGKAVVCNKCLEKDEEYETCSKNCRHHRQRALGKLEAA